MADPSSLRTVEAHWTFYYDKIRITREVELYSTPRMVYEGDDFPEGFNGIIKFHNLE